MVSGGAFYLADVKSLGADNKVKTEEKVLHFKLEKVGYDDRASRQNIKDYEVDYANFLAANPGYVNPFGDEPVVNFKVGSKVLNPGDAVAVPLGEKEASEEVKSDDEKTHELEEPATAGHELPESHGSEAPEGKDALESPEHKDEL